MFTLTAAAHTRPSDTLAPTASRRNRLASRSSLPPETVRPQGPTPLCATLVGRTPVLRRCRSKQRVVRDDFGFEEFRQEAVVEASLASRDALALIATGLGQVAVLRGAGPGRVRGEVRVLKNYVTGCDLHIERRGASTCHISEVRQHRIGVSRMDRCRMNRPCGEGLRGMHGPRTIDSKCNRTAACSPRGMSLAASLLASATRITGPGMNSSY